MKEKTLKYNYKKYITKVMAKTAEKYMNILKNSNAFYYIDILQTVTIATHCRFIRIYKNK